MAFPGRFPATRDPERPHPGELTKARELKSLLTPAP